MGGMEQLDLEEIGGGGGAYIASLQTSYNNYA